MFTIGWPHPLVGRVRDLAREAFELVQVSLQYRIRAFGSHLQVDMHEEPVCLGYGRDDWRTLEDDILSVLDNGTVEMERTEHGQKYEVQGMC